MDSSLFLICFAMFIGAFVAGLSCYKLNRRQLAWLNCFASGLLLGTALGVIVPEGVRSIYEENHIHENHEHEHEHEEDSHSERLLGWTLILGFLTMMIADGIFETCTGSHGHSHGLEFTESETLIPIKMQGSLKDVEESKIPEKSLREESSHHHHEKHEVISAERRRNTITLGLLIHNAMDGLAMGAAKAAMSSSTATQSVVFWAIMMHHVPASFGYATYLRNSGLDDYVVRRYVIVFSLAAPLATAITFFALHPGYFGFFVVSSKAVGTCLLFSAGTFLNVACVHALDEAKRGFPKWGFRQVLVLCIGAIVPGIVSWNHEH